MAATEIIIDGTRYELKAIPNEPKKEWEIVALREEGGHIYEKPVNPPPYWYNLIEHITNRSTLKTIHSVKRLSDGEIFSVGDEMTYRTMDKNSMWADGAYWCKIDSFSIHEGNIYVNKHHWGDKNENISDWVKKSKPKHEELKKSEGVSVRHFRENDFVHFGGNHGYTFETWGEIPKEKYSAMKQAIEQVLNEGKDCVFDNSAIRTQLGKLSKLVDASASYIEAFRNDKSMTSYRMANTIYSNIMDNLKFYSQEQLNKMMENSFNAAREQDWPHANWKHHSFQNYLSSNPFFPKK